MTAPHNREEGECPVSVDGEITRSNGIDSDEREFERERIAREERWERMWDWLGP